MVDFDNGEQARMGVAPHPCLFPQTHGPDCVFLSSLRLRTRNTRGILQQFLTWFVESYNCELADLWSLAPVRGQLLLVAIEGASATDLGHTVLDCATSLSGITVDRKLPTHFDDLGRTYAGGRQFGHPQLAKKRGLKSMVSVPVLNTWSPAQVLMIFNAFPTPGHAIPPDPILELQAQALAVHLEIHLRDESYRWSKKLGIALSALKRRTAETLCGELARLACEAVKSDYAAVFLETARGDELRLVAQTGSVRIPEIATCLKSGPATTYWKSQRAMTTLRLGDEPGFGLDIPAEPDECLTGAFVPLRDLAGQAKGVICFADKCQAVTRGGLRPFTYEDLALAEALGEAFVPQLEIILADQQRIDALNKLAHQLRVPVVAILAVREMMEEMQEEQDYTFLSKQLQDMELYCEAMKRICRELDSVRRGFAFTALTCRETHLESQIIMPARRFIEPLLTKRGFKMEQVIALHVKRIPRLHIDRALITHVVFNLMDNAIKYYRGDPATFRIEVENLESRDGYEVIFRDFGVGVPEGANEFIFEEGTRGENAEQYDVAGEGIGLWWSRNVMKLHGGDLRVRRSANPTEFAIIFPYELAQGPPLPGITRNSEE